jgi:FKBP-type peptidyl-prolyl cis-trans isomerase 2
MKVVEVGARTVIVDINSRWAGRALELEVELLGILTSAPRSDSPPA